jgi:hypothetical protein
MTTAGLLANADRRRVFAALVLGSSTYAALAEATGLDPKVVTMCLERMESAGFVTRDGDHIVLIDEQITAEARARPTPTPGIAVDGDAERQTVIRTFFRDGRLTHIPMQHKKRLVIFDVLAQRFEPGQLYSEARVNLELGKVHGDVAALRRGMVDNEFMERRDGMYWRAGGTFALDSTSAASSTETTSPSSTAPGGQ